MQILKNTVWHGNVRELQNIIERAVLLCRSETISVHDIMIEDNNQVAVQEDDFPSTTIEDMERRLIMKTLNEKSGNRTHAANALGISIRTLRNKLKEYKGKNLLAENI
jgi:two-component system response regulator FlrC